MFGWLVGGSAKSAGQSVGWLGRLISRLVGWLVGLS